MCNNLSKAFAISSVITHLLFLLSSSSVILCVKITRTPAVDPVWGILQCLSLRRLFLLCSTTFLFTIASKSLLMELMGLMGRYFHGNEGPTALYTEHIASARLESCWTRFLKIPVGILSWPVAFFASIKYWICNFLEPADECFLFSTLSLSAYAYRLFYIFQDLAVIMHSSE